MCFFKGLSLLLSVGVLGGLNLARLSLAAEPTITVTRSVAPKSIDFQRPDLSRYSLDNLRSSLPEYDGQGDAAVRPIGNERLLDEATRRERGDDLRQRQGTDELQFIEVSGGMITLAEVVDIVGNPKFAETIGDTTTIRLPILVRPDAELVIKGRTTPVVHLSTDRGAFIINGGRLDVVDAKVIGWDESSGTPSAFVDKIKFRPYLASMIRSEMNLIGSTFQCLGYASATSYGISYSTQPERKHGEPTSESPHGTIAGCTFDNLYYGFYTYEARDIAIVDCTYTDNIVYAIDPHDRTTRLLIAGNTTHGTRERHGIIGSRGVRDSLIIDNISYGNGGSGIMLDRECTNCVIAGNQVYSNNQGIAIYESCGNKIYDNLIGFNNSCALRVRNSVEVVSINNTMVGHGEYAVDLSARVLENQADRQRRGERYEHRLAVEIHGLRVGRNYGLMKGRNVEFLILSGVEQAIDLQALANRWGITTLPNHSAEQSNRFGNELKEIEDRLRVVHDAPTVQVELQDTPDLAVAPY